MEEKVSLMENVSSDVQESENYKNYKYDAFISYRHLPLDKAVAVKLQALLENYRPPRQGRYANGGRIRRVFRDQSELPTSGDLGNDIRNALGESRYLIVVCSEHTAESAWCMEEIRQFKENNGGRTDHILTLIVSGEPEDVFPEELRMETERVAMPDGSVSERKRTIEPLCADVRTQSLRKSLILLKTEFLRLAAPILGCGFDDLYRRHQRRKRKRIMASVLGCGIVLTGVLLVVSLFAYRTWLSEKSYRSILTEQYTRQGADSQAEGKNQEALLYYARAMELEPEETYAARAGTAILLQGGRWPYVQGSEDGFLLGARQITGCGSMRYEAADASGSLFLGIMPDGNAVVYGQDGNVEKQLGEMGDFLGESEDGKYWIFCGTEEITFYNTEDETVRALPRPSQLSRGCEMDENWPVEYLPAAVTIGDTRAAVMYGGLLYLYEWKEEGPSLVKQADMANVFPDDAEKKSLSVEGRLWISADGSLLLAAQLTGAAAFDALDLKLTASAIQYHYGLTDADVSSDGRYFALSYGNNYNIAYMNSGGFTEVYDCYGSLKFTTENTTGEPVLGVCFEKREPYRLLGWGNGTVWFWDTGTGEEAAVPIRSDQIAGAAFEDGFCVVDDGRGSLDHYQLFEPIFPLPEPMGQAASPQEYGQDPPMPEDLKLADSQWLAPGLAVGSDYLNLYLMDGEGQVLSQTHLTNAALDIKLSRDGKTIYAYSAGKFQPARVPVDVTQRKLGEQELLDVHGYNVTNVWPSGDMAAVSTGDNHLLLYPGGSLEPERILKLRNAGQVKNVFTSSDGKYLAVQLQSAEPEPGSYRFHIVGAVEIWDVLTGLHLQDYGDGRHDIDQVYFTEDGTLLININGQEYYTRIGMPAPDQETVEFLLNLTCCDFDDKQNVVTRKPVFEERFGSWKEELQERESVGTETAGQDLSEESTGAGGEEITVSLAEEVNRLSGEISRMDEETWFAGCEELWGRLLEAEVPYTLKDLDAFFHLYVKQAVLQRRTQKLQGVEAYILLTCLKLDGAEEWGGEFNYESMELLAGFQEYDMEVAAALSMIADIQEKTMHPDEYTYVLEQYTILYDRCYAQLLAGAGLAAMEPVLEFCRGLDGMDNIFIEVYVYEMLGKGQSEAAARTTSAWAVSEEKEGLEQKYVMEVFRELLRSCYVLAERGYLAEDVFGDYISRLDMECGIELVSVPASAQEAGFRKGDFIVAVDGTAIVCFQQAIKMTEGPGHVVSVRREEGIVYLPLDEAKEAEWSVKVLPR